MKIGNVDGRAVIVDTRRDVFVDIFDASDGTFGPSPSSVLNVWDDFTVWAKDVDLSSGDELHPTALGAPVPDPRQVFAVGLNYRAHATESGFDLPQDPTVFTKFVSCIGPPHSEVQLPPGGRTDWEVELVVVIGREANDVPPSSGWSYVAGLTVGQDLSERDVQSAGPVPQFSLGKSFAGFGPTGPWFVTLDEFDDPDDLPLGCSVNGEVVQEGRTSDLVFSVPTLVSRLSSIVTLFPGDLIFTGTPAGVGVGRNPQVFLASGDRLESWIDGIGAMTQTFS